MRSILLITTVLILVMAAPSLAQEWTDYTSKTDFFHVNFPGHPKVQDINYPTAYGDTLPGNIYTVATVSGSYYVMQLAYHAAATTSKPEPDTCHSTAGAAAARCDR